MNLAESADEIVAFIMAVAGVALLLFGSYAIICMDCDVAIKDLLLISNALLLPSTAYLFGKSVPKQEKPEKK